MAKYNYDNITAKALELVNRFGTDVYLIKPFNSTWDKKYDPVELNVYWENTLTGFITFEEPEMDSFLGDGVITSFKTKEIDGTLIQRDDRLILATKIPVPQLGDTIRVGDVEYKYISHKSVAPNNVTILYRIQVRL